MSNYFRNSVKLSEILTNLSISYDVDDSFDFDQDVEAISDSNKVVPNSLCDYIKGSLPTKVDGLILFAKENIDGFCCIIVDNPQQAIAEVIEHISSTIGFKAAYEATGIHSSVTIGQNVVIEENVEVGRGTKIEHNVVIHSGTKIGENCLIRTHSSIGGDGYGFFKSNNGELKKFPHIGGVEIGDNVEIGSNTCIVRGIINDTYIGNNVKVDNLVHIAHDCFIDEDAYIIACSELSGYVQVGKRARIAPNACVKQRITIGNDSLVGLGAVVLKDVKEGDIVAGNPAKSLKRK